jgi:hypothetical protein
MIRRSNHSRHCRGGGIPLPAAKKEWEANRWRVRGWRGRRDAMLWNASHTTAFDIDSTFLCTGLCAVRMMKCRERQQDVVSLHIICQQQRTIPAIRHVNRFLNNCPTMTMHKPGHTADALLIVAQFNSACKLRREFKPAVVSRERLRCSHTHSCD